MKIEESINESVDLENRSPSSSKLFTKLSITASLVALILFFISAIIYQINSVWGLNAFASVIIPIIVLLVAALYLAIAERLRAKYMGAVVALVICGVVILCLIGFVIFELTVHGEIFIAPFNPPPALK